MLRIPSKGVSITPYRSKYDLSLVWRELDLPKCKRPYYWTTKVSQKLRERKLVEVKPVRDVDKSYSMPRRNRTTYASMEGVLEYLYWIDSNLYLEAITASRI